MNGFKSNPTLGGKDFSWTAAIYLELCRDKIDLSVIKTDKL